MDSKGRSLPAMPEPRSPASMKQPPDSPGGRKGRGDMSVDPALLMDKATAQLAATPQEDVLQKIGNHNHTHSHNHTKERLKDLTSRLLNGDQDKLPKLCATTVTQPLLKGVEPTTQLSSPQRKSSSSPELTLKITKFVANGKPAATARYDSGYADDGLQSPNSPLGPPEGILGVPSASKEGRRRKKGPVRKRTPPNRRRSHLLQDRAAQICNTTQSCDTTPESHDPTTVQAAESHDQPVSESCDLAVKSNNQSGVELPAAVLFAPVQQPKSSSELGADSQPQVQFSLGDVVWTKVSGYPWWPCIVTTDPEFNLHVKVKAAGGRSGPLYHVQYFGDTPERGYVFEKSMVAFRGKEQYAELCRSNKQLSPRTERKKLSIPRKLRLPWETGVSLATEAIALTPEERLAKFSFVYENGQLQFNPRMLQELRAQHQPKLQQEDGEMARLNPTPDSESQPTVAQLLPSFPSQPHNSTSAEKKPSASKAPKAPTRRGHQKDPRASGQSRPKTAVSTKETTLTKSTPQKEVKRLKQKSVVTAKPKKKTKTGAVMTENSQTKSLNPAVSGKKSTLKRPPEEMTEEDQTLPQKKKAKLEMLGKEQKSKFDSVDPTDMTKGKKRQKTTTDGRAKGLVSGEELPVKAKRVRKRKQDLGSQSADTASKKRRPLPQPEPERPDSPSSSTDETQTSKKNERVAGAKRENVCLACEQTGEDLVSCEGQCCGSYHLGCVGSTLSPEEKVLCQACRTGVHACFSCKQSDGEVRRCSVVHCGRFYHEACLRLNALTVFENRGFRCPLHTCLSCHYSRNTAKATKGKMMRCLRCPVAYHVGDQCVAAGSEMLTPTAILCTNHFNAKKGYSHHSHVNVSWCFICSKGGSLLCCESCPAAFHPDCLNIAMPDGSWFCNDCRSGKKPKYRDIIWVKLGNYRWWPAEIRHPRNVPTNIQNLRHEIGEFPVFFFGSKDYFWTHQGRVFPYMEGDRGSKHQKTGIGKVFKNALLEAEARFKEIKMEREAKEAQENNRKPPPYKYIKINKPCGRVQIYTADISEIPKCNCKPTDEKPCSFESECLNRMLMYECHPQVCPAGERCHNQDFTKRLYPETKIIRTAEKGWGLLAMRDIKKGEFVNEYVGELIDEEECRARIKYAQENDITHFYMLTIDKDRIIDAGPKGNYSRFMNHSCQPNCETQKWTVNGDTRVGLFAVCDIAAGTELTFNYNLDCLGNEKTVCRCGAPNCSGFLGDRPKNGQASEHKGKAQKKKPKKRRARNEGKKQSEDECFRCGDGGELVLCDRKGCTKAYHLSCLDRTKRPFGRWDCPWHHCDVCGKNSDAFCQLCPNSFCKAHQEGALRPYPATGQLCCQEHEDSEILPPLEPADDKTPSSELTPPTAKPSKERRKPATKTAPDCVPKKGLKKNSKKAEEA
ncbi:histone-lysine N-methyltransferase NSD2 [Chanos chanos]|uniref:Histone-lysine N-methyltransferase NSD2 n=1 Tax=Chanos chanos TaxID=29144 RepID=A0A6J2V5I9_CHACN|nr:histone-lysine N-methyltransferase NSD2 [Chanos chanos]